MKEKTSISSDLNRLDKMVDADIDYSDIPPLDESFLTKEAIIMPKKREAVFCNMTINNLELYVYLGWAAKELSHARKVSLDLEIQFAEPLKACNSDNLNDTICYSSLIQAIRQHITEKRFHLLEHFGFTIYQVTKAFIAASGITISAAVKVRVTKYPQIEEYPQLGGSIGGASFCCGDNNC